MSIKRVVNQKLFLSLQLHDGADSMPLRVFCDLFNQDGALLEPTFEIPHLSLGLFTEDTKIFPSGVQTLFARFHVRENDGLTINPDHSDALDRYDLETPVEIPSTIVPKPFALTARVAQNRIKGQVRQTQRITGEVRDE